MKTTVAKIPDLQREKGYIYFIDRQGDLSRTRRSTGHYRQKFPHHKVQELGISRKPGHWYYIQKGGQVVEFQPNPPKPKNCRTPSRLSSSRR